MRFPIFLAVTVACLTSMAQAAKPAPRAPDGKPDLSGFWQGPLMRNFFQSVGGPPFTPEGKKAYEYNMKQSINPEGLCIMAGVPRASISGVPFEILQNPQRVAFLYELMTAWRSIPINGGVHPQTMDPFYFGNGAARWDGDTLVIDIVQFKDTKSWIDAVVHVHEGGDAKLCVSPDVFAKVRVIAHRRAA